MLTATVLFASLKGDEGTFSGEVRSVNVTNIHLKRIVAVNELSRAIERGGVPLADAFSACVRLRRCRAGRPWLRVLAWWCGRRGFCVSVRRHSAGRTGRAAGQLCAGAAAHFLRGAARTGLLRTLLSAAGGGCERGGGAADEPWRAPHAAIDKVIIGGIIPLVPGIALTNGVRDIAGM